MFQMISSYIFFHGWLPANCLLRLRWACKYWFHLITRDSNFVKLHLHCSTSTTTIHSHNNLSVLISKPLNWSDYLSPSYPPFKFFQRYIGYSTTTTTTTTGSFSGPATNPILSGNFRKFNILGSCNGLILFAYICKEQQETKLCIWNPCTKEYKYLPHPHDFDRYKYFGFGTNFGLGYDHSIKDYKVIYSVNRNNHVLVYTLGTNSWRYFGSFAINDPNSYVGLGHGMFVNGALYFIHQESNAFIIGSRARIFCLDFEKEMYEEISNQPECLNDNGKAKSIVGLAMFEGSLCLTIRTQDDICCYTKSAIETWVMKKDYNMNNNKDEYSWSKLYEIPQHDSLLRYFLQPLRFTKEGEILLLDHMNSLLSFDPKNNKVVTINNEDYKPCLMEIEAIYTESLVSLNSGTYIDGQGNFMRY